MPNLRHMFPGGHPKLDVQPHFGKVCAAHHRAACLCTNKNDNKLPRAKRVAGRTWKKNALAKRNPDCTKVIVILQQDVFADVLTPVSPLRNGSCFKDYYDSLGQDPENTSAIPLPNLRHGDTEPISPLARNDNVQPIQAQ